jgi:phosphoheptose isomerase
MHRNHFKQPPLYEAQLIFNCLGSFNDVRYFLADFFGQFQAPTPELPSIRATDNCCGSPNAAYAFLYDVRKIV